MIKAVVFDVGGVLIDVNWSYAINAGLIKREMLKDVGSWDVYLNYERGSVSTSDFLKQLKAHWSLNVADNDLLTIWNSCLGTEMYPEVLPILEELAKKTKLFILSNTNESHFKKFRSFHGMNYFEKFFVSHEMGMRKPDLEIYQQVIKEIGCKPNEILFLDDRIENINAAKELGIIAEQTVYSPQKTKEILTASP